MNYSDDRDEMTFIGKSSDAENVVNESTMTQMSITAESEVRDILWQYKNNRSITTPLYYVILCTYVAIGILAIFSNSLVVLAVIRNKKV